MRYLAAFLILGALAATHLHAETPADLLSQADRFAEAGNWSAARPLYATAEEQFHKSGDVRNELWAKLGRLHNDVQRGSYRSVRDEVTTDLRNPVVQSDPKLKLRALALKGVIDLNLNTSAASDDWKQVLETATSIGDRKWQNRANGELALVAGLKGEVGAAGIALYKALNTAVQLGDLDAQVNFATWLGNGMAVNGMADRALLLLNKVIDLTSKSRYTGLPLQLYIAKIRALTLLPEPQREKAKAEAKTLLADTLAKARSENVLGAEAELLNVAAELAAEEKDAVVAERSLKEMVRIAHEANLPRMEAEGLFRLSKLCRADRRASSALRAIDQAIVALQMAEEAYDLPLYLAEKAEVEASRSHFRSADRLYEQATKLVDGLLVNAFSSRVKSSMIGAMGDIYLGHFRLVWTKLHNTQRALQIIESARGRALLDSIRYGKHFGPKTPEEIRAENDIAQLQRTLLRETLSWPRMKRVLGELDDAYDRLSPGEFARNRTEMERLRQPPVSLGALRRELGRDQCLIEYVLDTNTSYAFSITPTQTSVHMLPGRKQIDKLVSGYLDAVKERRDSKANARSLYAAILAPVLGDRVSSVIIVPDGSLHRVPFSALIREDGAYVVQGAAVSTAPSATIYYTVKTARSRISGTRPFLGVAYSPLDAGKMLTGSTARGIFDLSGAKLRPLPFAPEEVAEAARFTGSQSLVLTGPDASEAALKNQPLQDFRIIHIAAHAIGNDEDPDRAALVLAPGNDVEDGLWQAREIRHASLNADLVVLSACETGTGRLQGEEGVMDLARVFLIAGAKSAVASLWSVDDRSTATLMGHFYQRLADGVPVAFALRKAQLDFIKEYGDKAEPFYWAGFVVIGDGTRQISFKTDNINARSARAGVRQSSRESHKTVLRPELQRDGLAQRGSGTP